MLNMTTTVTTVTRPTLPTKTQIKLVRKSVRQYYNNPVNKAMEQWETVYNSNKLEEAYGHDPNKQNSKIGKEANVHFLDSDGIRKELLKHTPIGYPPIIPLCCDLRFFYTIDGPPHCLLSGPLNLSQRFDNIDQMKNIFNHRLYTSKLQIIVSGKTYDFWVKSIKKSGTAFVRAFGIEVSDYIMRYRPVIYVQLGAVVMELHGDNVGVGFCNLQKTKKVVRGHQMIQLEVETMDNVYLQFYRAYNRHNVTINDISIKVIRYQQKNNKVMPKKEDPMLLFDGTKYIHGEGKIVQIAQNDDVSNNQMFSELDVHPQHNINQLTQLQPEEYRPPSVPFGPILSPQSNDSYSTVSYQDNMFPLSPLACFSSPSPLRIAEEDEFNEHDFPTSPWFPFYPQNVSPSSFELNLADVDLCSNRSTNAMDDHVFQQRQRFFQSLGGFNNPREGIHRQTMYRDNNTKCQRIEEHIANIRNINNADVR